jgi:hypothetical protein
VVANETVGEPARAQALSEAGAARRARDDARAGDHRRHSATECSSKALPSRRPIGVYPRQEASSAAAIGRRAAAASRARSPPRRGHRISTGRREVIPVEALTYSSLVDRLSVLHSWLTSPRTSRMSSRRTGRGLRGPEPPRGCGPAAHTLKAAPTATQPRDTYALLPAPGNTPWCFCRSSVQRKGVARTSPSCRPPGRATRIST